MEHELVSTAGVKMYIDVVLEPFRFAFECDGFVAHAENVTRERFAFERMRVRTMAMYGYKYIPFSWDEMDKRPEACRRTVYELLGRYSASMGTHYLALSVYERETLRCALRLNRPLRLADMNECLQLGPEASRRVLRKLMDKQLIRPMGKGSQRHHEYVVERNAADYLL